MSVRHALPLALACAALPALSTLPPAASAEGGRFLQGRPGATLLLPYFEVALPKRPGRKAKGVNTIVTLTSAAGESVLTHVTIWSDFGIPVMFFDLYLTGFDSETLDLAEVFDGRLPATAPAGQDPDDTISPQGDFSVDQAFPGCDGILPPMPQLPAASVEHMRAALTGKESPLVGMCFGRDYGEKKPVARGYLTVDTVSQCSVDVPGDPGYFIDGGNGIATNQNVLFGDWTIGDEKGSYGGPMVSLQADASDPVSDAAGDYTFYARQVAATAVDDRQPLAATWGARYVVAPKDPLFRKGTSLIVWRDHKVDQDAFPCGETPTFFPLSQTQIVAFDHQENPEAPMLPPVPPLPPESIQPFQAATQRVAVDGDDLPISFERGWIFLNLNTLVASQIPGLSVPERAQSFVIQVLHGKRASTAMTATPLESAGD